MRRGWTLIAASTLALMITLPAVGQDSPSLGDLARQAQKDRKKDRANKPAAKVLTNDDMPSNSGGVTSALGGNLGQGGQSPAEKLSQMERFLNQVDSMDKATLVRSVLGDKKNIDFPGRPRWEERLVAAKQTYIVQARELIEKAKEIIASADSIKGNQDPNDPRVKEVSAKLQTMVRDAVQTNAGLQAVIIEGRDLASQAAAH